MIAIEQDLSFLSSRRFHQFENTLWITKRGGHLSASSYFDRLSLALLGSLAKLTSNMSCWVWEATGVHRVPPILCHSHSNKWDLMTNLWPYCRQHQYPQFCQMPREEFKALHELYDSVQTNWIYIYIYISFDQLSQLSCHKSYSKLGLDTTFIAVIL